jgi:predicted nucleic acid-binding Zn ribbon protein
VRSIQSFSNHVLVELIRQQPASKEKTRFVWQMAVGPALARVTTVDLADGVLTVRCSDARWIPELTRAREVVLGRLQQVLGAEQIRRLTIAE